MIYVLFLAQWRLSFQLTTAQFEGGPSHVTYSASHQYTVVCTDCTNTDGEKL